MRSTPPTHTHRMLCFPSGKFFACQYFWKLSGPSKLNFFSSEKTIFHHFLVLMVWYWWAYSSHFSFSFIVNFGWWILFLYLIFSLFKCLLIVLVLQGTSTRDFNIFYVEEVFFFTSQTILLLNCGDNFSGLPVGFLVPYLFGLFK